MPNEAYILRSANVMIDLILGNSALIDLLKIDPKKTLKNIAAQVTKPLPKPTFTIDNWTCCIVAIVLGIVVISAMIRAVYLSAQGNEFPDLLTARGATAIGALAGLLKPVPGHLDIGKQLAATR